MDARLSACMALPHQRTSRCGRHIDTILEFLSHLHGHNVQYFGVYASLNRTKGNFFLRDLRHFSVLTPGASSTDILRVKMTSDESFDKTLQKEQLEILTTWVLKFSKDLRGGS